MMTKKKFESQPGLKQGQKQIDQDGAYEKFLWWWECSMNLMVVISQVYKFVKTHQSVYLKWVDFSERNVYLNKVDLKKKVKAYFQINQVGCMSLSSLLTSLTKLEKKSLNDFSNHLKKQE